MRAFSSLLFGAVASLIGSTVAAPLVAHSGGVQDVVITNQNTVNATHTDVTNSTASGGQLTLNLVNNFAGSVNAYVTGLDSNNQLVILQTDGTWLYPSANGASTPQNVTGNIALPLGAQGSTTTFTLPDYISAGRVWFAANGELQFFVVQGESGPSLVEPSSNNPSDPSAQVNWGFVELTNMADSGLWANISYVDFVGLPLGMSLTGSQGTQTALGLPSDAVSSICNDLTTQAASDGQPWNQLCVYEPSGSPLRVIAPGDFAATNSAAFSDYWTDYVNQVWEAFSSTNSLTVDTQAGAGNVSCTVTDGTLNCAGDNRGYAPPTASDIWGCNTGPFAIEENDNDVHYAVVPRLCAAFHRSTFMLDGGLFQPSLGTSSYYTTTPTNIYSKTVHKYELDGRGYAFAYDDVAPDGVTNVSGELTDPSPQSLTVTVGGPSSS